MAAAQGDGRSGRDQQAGLAPTRDATASATRTAGSDNAPGRGRGAPKLDAADIDYTCRPAGVAAEAHVTAEARDPTSAAKQGPFHGRIATAQEQEAHRQRPQKNR